MAAGAELLCGGLVLAAVAALLDDLPRFDPAAVSGRSWLGLGWLIANAVAGFAAYGFLLRAVPTSVSSTFSYVNPIVAIGLGWLLFDESVTRWTLAATAVVVAGVCLIVTAKAKPD